MDKTTSFVFDATIFAYIVCGKIFEDKTDKTDNQKNTEKNIKQNVPEKTK